MDCNEVQKYISAVVDSETDATVKNEVSEHLRKCNGCRNEFELEQFTKYLVGNNLPKVTSPASLVTAISNLLSSERQQQITQRSWYHELLDLLRWRTALAVSGALAVIVLLTLIPARSHHSHAQPIDNNIIHQTYNNFDSVLDGKIVPTMASTDPLAVKAYFTSKVNFNVHVPRLKTCSLVGGVLSEYKKECMANVVYKHNDKIIYVYQAKLGSVMGACDLQLPDEAKHDLAQTGWYFENHSPDCSLALWIVDSTLCCAIADIPKEQLIACLKDAE